MNTTRLCLIRHGETHWNTERRLQGHTDVELNHRGKAQAIQMATALKKLALNFDALYTSDLKRAADTANAIVREFKVPAIVMSDLRERHFGALQGLSISDAPTLKPKLWQAHMARDIDHELEGGESIAQFARRVQDALEMILQKHFAETVILVSHGGTLDMMYRIATGQALVAPRIASVPNASLNWLTHNGQKWSIGQWADTQHLDGLALENIDL
jgi:probable phosphoglycerate mutase